LAKDYGKEDIVHSGPLYKSMSVEGNRIRIRFDHVGTGLKSRDGKPPTWFSIAGLDRKFVAAVAEIEGDTVLVSSNSVTKPIAVRFGWSNLAEPNLSNKEGLPASPFRTDSW
jgi:sialate O-acetylesterase